MKRNIIYFVVLGLIYLNVEVIFRAITYYFHMYPYLSLMGFTSLWMFFIGGLSALVLGFINRNVWINSHINIFWQSIMGAFMVLLIEFLTGMFFNVYLKFNLWSYNGYWLNIKGQICLLFGIFWFLLCPAAFWINDVIHYYLYQDIKAPYSLIEIYKQLFQINAKGFVC